MNNPKEKLIIHTSIMQEQMQAWLAILGWASSNKLILSYQEFAITLPYGYMEEVERRLKDIQDIKDYEFNSKKQKRKHYFLSHIRFTIIVLMDIFSLSDTEFKQVIWNLNIDSEEKLIKLADHLNWELENPTVFDKYRKHLADIENSKSEAKRIIAIIKENFPVFPNVFSKEERRLAALLLKELFENKKEFGVAISYLFYDTTEEVLAVSILNNCSASNAVKWISNSEEIFKTRNN